MFRVIATELTFHSLILIQCLLNRKAETLNRTKRFAEDLHKNKISGSELKVTVFHSLFKTQSVISVLSINQFIYWTFKQQNSSEYQQQVQDWM